MDGGVSVRVRRFLDDKRLGRIVGVVSASALICSGGGSVIGVSPEHFGIGATLVKADSVSAAVVRSCFKGGPADRAGLMPGDTLVELDGRSVRSWSLKAIIDYLIRDEPLALRITLHRRSASYSVELVRARISDIAAGVGLRYVPNEDSTNYTAVPLHEVPGAVAGDTLSVIDFVDRACRDVRFISPQREYTFFYFWASWCGPCKIIMKEVEQKSVDSSRVCLVGVNVDSSCEVFRAAVDSLGTKGEQYWGGGWYGELTQKFRVHRRGIPTAAVLDRNARLIGVSTGVDSVLLMLRRLED